MENTMIIIQILYVTLLVIGIGWYSSNKLNKILSELRTLKARKR